MKNDGLKSAILQLGIDVVKSYVGECNVGNCEMHGHFLIGTTDENGNTQLSCPMCSSTISTGNGITATEIEHIIDMRNEPDRMMEVVELTSPFMDR